LAPLMAETKQDNSFLDFLNDRENMYLQAIVSFHQRNFRRSFQTFAELGRSFPSDLCVLRQLDMTAGFFPGGSWSEVISVLEEMQASAEWSKDNVPLPFAGFLAYAYHNAGFTEDAYRQYEVLLEMMGESAKTNSFIVHIGAHIKTFSSPACEAIAFLEQGAEHSSFFVGPFREHILMHLGALYAFSLDFNRGLSTYDRLWDAPGGDADRNTSFFFSGMQSCRCGIWSYPLSLLSVTARFSPIGSLMWTDVG